MCWTSPQIREKIKTNKTKKSQHIMCWTSPHTGEKIKTNKTKNHNTLCVGHQHT
jgi:hypothetical protein